MAFSRLTLGLSVASLLTGNTCAQSSYVLVDDYLPNEIFFDGFRFYTGGDPTNGFVQYVNRSYAEESGLISTHPGHVIVGVDHTNIYNASTGPGRPSIRLESLKTYTHGLFILSLNHMPFGCGTWPAFWTLGPDWPKYGEIDIIEGVNLNQFNIPVLHTQPGCTVAGANETGTLLTSNCGDSTIGCGVQDNSPKSYGMGFNAAGGGVYAMEWTSEYIRVWGFGPNAIPPSILNGKPNTNEFPEPAANFEGSLGSCDIDEFFNDHYIVFDITFCGDYAGNVYSSSNCPNATGGYTACETFIAENPSSFTNAYWSINYLRVYQQQGSSSSVNPSTVSLSSVTPVAVSSKGILSSLQSDGMGSSSPHIPSSTLSVPKSKSSRSNSAQSRSSSSTITSRKKPAKTSESSKTQHHTSQAHSSTTTPEHSLPTVTGVPRCHTIFEDNPGLQYRIYCNATISGRVLESTTTSKFSGCIGLCDKYGSSCIGTTFSNSTKPPSCVLKAGTFFLSNMKRDNLISREPGMFAAVRVQPHSSSSSVDSNHHESQKRQSASTSISVSVSTIVILTHTVSKGHNHVAQTSLSHSNRIHTSSDSICLCYTCGLVPTVVTTGCPSPNTIGTTTNNNVGPGTIHTPPPSTIPGACNIARTIIVTKLVQTTITTCNTPLTCPAKSTHTHTLSSGQGSPPGVGPGLSGKIHCGPDIADGAIYTDAAGMVYKLYCGQVIVGPSVDEQKQQNFVHCLSACDQYNVVDFKTQGCAGVSFDKTSGICQLKAVSGTRKPSLHSDSGILLSRMPGGGHGGSGPSSSGSGLGSGGHSSHVNHITSAKVTVYTSHGHTITSTYGSSTISHPASSKVQTSYLVTTKISNGHTIISTYSTKTLPAQTSASVSVSVSTHLSTIISRGHTSVRTIVSTLSASQHSASGPGGGPGPNSGSALNPSVITITRHGKVQTLTGKPVTITEPGKVVTVTRHGQVRTITEQGTSYEISYVFATVTVTTGGGSSSSSSTSRSCRTAATHYADSTSGMRRRKRSVLEGILAVEKGAQDHW